jgi:hypothetical protein
MLYEDDSHCAVSPTMAAMPNSHSAFPRKLHGCFQTSPQTFDIGKYNG